MASNNEAKVRFTAETSDFTQAIKDANSEMSTLRAEMKLNEAQFQNTGNETEYLQQKTELLQSQLEANAEKQEALTQKLEAAKDIYGEDSEEVAKLERQLIYAQTEEEKLKNQLDQTSQGLTDQASAAEESGSSMEAMADVIMNAEIASYIKDMAEAAMDLAEAFDEASATIVEGTGASGEALEDLNQQAQDAFGRIADADQDINGVSGILAELNTRFGLTGDELEDLTVKVSNFAQHTDSDGVGSVDNIANVMKRWGILAGAIAIAATIKAVTSAVGALSGVMTILSNPVFLVITAIAALAAGLIYAYKHSETFRNIVNAVFNTIKTVVPTVIQTVTNVIRTAVSTVSGLFNAAKSTVTSIFNGIKAVATSVWNAIKTAITNPVQTAKSTVTSIFNGIRSTISGVVNGIKSTVSSAFNAIKSAMTKPIETAKSTISGIVNKIKGIFPLHIGKIFSGLSLPHISVSAGKAPFGIGGKGSLPHFSVNWHAKGVVFDAPTLFPTLNGWHGVGEAGPEAVSPISTLQDYISTAVAAAVPVQKEIDYERLANTFTKMNTYIELNGREIGRAVRSMV